jgi:hypothetical protein
LTANQSKSFTNNFTVTVNSDAMGVDFCLISLLSYNGVVQDENDANDQSCTTVNFVVSATGINEVAGASAVKAYPNPANTDFTITTTTTNATVDIMDITGKLVESSAVTMGEARFDVSNYKNGVYFFNIRTATGSVEKSGKFTVSH